MAVCLCVWQIADPAADLAHTPIIDALHQLLATDGF